MNETGFPVVVKSGEQFHKVSSLRNRRNTTTTSTDRVFVQGADKKKETELVDKICEVANRSFPEVEELISCPIRPNTTSALPELQTPTFLIPGAVNQGEQSPRDEEVISCPIRPDTTSSLPKSQTPKFLIPGVVSEGEREDDFGLGVLYPEKQEALSSSPGARVNDEQGEAPEVEQCLCVNEIIFISPVEVGIQFNPDRSKEPRYDSISLSMEQIENELRIYRRDKATVDRIKVKLPDSPVNSCPSCVPSSGRLRPSKLYPTFHDE